MNKNGKLTENQGFWFDVDGNGNGKYHINYHNSFLECGTCMHEFGGNFSTRFPDGLLPIILFVKDKTVYINSSWDGRKCGWHQAE